MLRLDSGVVRLVGATTKDGPEHAFCILRSLFCVPSAECRYVSNRREWCNTVTADTTCVVCY